MTFVRFAKPSEPLPLERLEQHVFLTNLCIAFFFGFGDEEEGFSSETDPEKAVQDYLKLLATDNSAANILMNMLGFLLESYAELSADEIRQFVMTTDWPVGMGAVSDVTKESYEADYDPGFRQFNLLRENDLCARFAIGVRRIVKEQLPASLLRKVAG